MNNEQQQPIASEPTELPHALKEAIDAPTPGESALAAALAEIRKLQAEIARLNRQFISEGEAHLAERGRLAAENARLKALVNEARNAVLTLIRYVPRGGHLTSLQEWNNNLATEAALEGGQP